MFLCVCRRAASPTSCFFFFRRQSSFVVVPPYSYVAPTYLFCFLLLPKQPGCIPTLPILELTPRHLTTRRLTARETSLALPGCLEKIQGGTAQYAIGPTSFSTSAISTMTMASHGQPSRKHPSGPLLRHFLHPMHWMGSIWMRPNGGLSSSGTQNIQSSTGQYSTQAGDPAQPVQHSVI